MIAGGLETDMIPSKPPEDDTLNNEFREAKQYAFHLLQYKPYNTHQLREKLEKRNIASEVSERVITELVDYGYIDDIEWAYGVLRYEIRKGNRTQVS